MMMLIYLACIVYVYIMHCMTYLCVTANYINYALTFEYSVYIIHGRDLENNSNIQYLPPPLFCRLNGIPVLMMQVTLSPSVSDTIRSDILMAVV